MPGPDHHSVELVVAAGDVDVVLDRIWMCQPLAVGEASADPGSTRFTVGFTDREAAEAAMETLAAWQPELRSVASDEWVSTWRQGVAPQDAGPFRVRLPEHHPATDRIDLVVEPGTSFGFGHASTLLAIELLAEVDLAGATVVDIGSGSGVLGIAAGLLGATAVHAVDIAPEALAATADNARRNDVEIALRRGSVEALPAAVADVVLANLTAATQADVLPHLGSRLGDATSVILSGLLEGQERTVAALIDDFVIADALRRDGWIAVRLAPSRIANALP